MGDENKIDDGGRAFPNQVEQIGPHVVNKLMTGGMSLREHYIGQALTGICANPNYLPHKSQINDSFIRDMGRLAVDLADSALQARQPHD